MPSNHNQPARDVRLAIGIATRGRADMLAETLAEVARQTRTADRIVVCGAEASDVATAHAMEGVDVLIALPGLPRQRNAILDAVDGCDLILFLDDDFFMAPGYIAATLGAFAADPRLVVTTGWTLADGARGPGFTAQGARAIIAEDAGRIEPTGVQPQAHGYGCNMALRLEAVREHNLRFDERLPLYGWSEDVDFTHRLGRHGGIAKVMQARGVHLGVKSGRTPGCKLGYSQVANPIYLFGKGSYSFGRAMRSVARNLAANAVRSVWSEPFIDRRGRLRGNATAFLDLVRGRMQPERILEL